MDRDEKMKALIAERMKQLDKTLSLIIHEPEAQEIADAVKRHIANSFKSTEAEPGPETDDSGVEK